LILPSGIQTPFLILSSTLHFVSGILARYEAESGAKPHVSVGKDGFSPNFGYKNFYSTSVKYVIIKSLTGRYKVQAETTPNVDPDQA
jgi:hypothetical protein